MLTGDVGKMERDLHVADCVGYFSGCYIKMPGIHQLKEEICSPKGPGFDSQNYSSRNSNALF